MRRLLLDRPYSCTPICHVAVTLERFVDPLGPAGDVVYVPMRITGGSVTGAGPAKAIVGGTDFAMMYADEKLVHNGNLIVADPAGDIIIWYDGSSQAEEGAYDDVVDGRLPAGIPCRLSIRFVSSGSDFRRLNRRPLLGVGSFNGIAGTLEFTLLSVTEAAKRN